MEKNELRKLCMKININNNYRYNYDRILGSKMYFLKNNCNSVLDIGKSSREWYEIFKEGQITTLDINQYEGYPNIIDDICNIKKVSPSSYDGIICLAVLEHVYAPELAVDNLYKVLKNPGYFLGYLPFIYRYHAPKDMIFQDFYRFSKDGIAYLFRNFRKITLFPSRGKYSTMLNLHRGWKKIIERIFGQKINRVIDRIFLKSVNKDYSISGYLVWAIK